MKYVKDYKDGDRVFDIYLCKHKLSAVTKTESLMRALFYRIRQEQSTLKYGIPIMQESQSLPLLTT